MRIKASTPDAAAATLPCDNCGKPSTPFCQLFLFIGDNPPDGAVTVRAISQGFRFCSPACRSTWWETPTADAIIPSAVLDVAPRLAETPHPLTALVCHVDRETAHLPVTAVDDAGNVLAVQSGVPESYHAFDDLPQLESWWRGEQAGVDIPLDAVTEGAP